jgi:hypothetical protein
MFLLSAMLILGFTRILQRKLDYDKHHVNITNIISAKATTDYQCPPPDPDTDECSSKYGTANDEITKSSGFDSATAIGAVNDFIAACGATKCQSSCKTYASNVAPTAAASDTNFEENCEPVTAVKTEKIEDSVCEANPAPINVVTECDASYQAVLIAVTPQAGTPPVLWVGETVKEKIDDFGEKCPKTACVTACRTLISSKNVANEYTSLKTNFIRDCNPNPPTQNPATPNPTDGSSVVGKNKLPFILLVCLFSIGLINSF